MKNKEKNKKQEVKDNPFSINNIENANELINKNHEESKEESKVVYLLRIDKDFYDRFHFLKNERAIRQKKYDEYNTQVFIIMLSVVKECLVEKGIYEKSTEIFNQIVNKRGKRKKNKRTVSKDRLEELTIHLSSDKNQEFLNCFYSVIKNNPEESINDSSLSKNYFFNDIIEIISNNKNTFYKYVSNDLKN
ncbi:MAG TPA: hypothetical protein DDE71_00955 [Tenacibaculum sp.]|nr:hypothetical protein [Tenacibaculum sp.]